VHVRNSVRRGNTAHVPPQEQAEEEEVGEDAKANDAKVKDAKVGEQLLPARKLQAEDADRQTLPIGQLARIAEVNPPNYHEGKCKAEKK
jgi:hypothetical protein